MALAAVVFGSTVSAVAARADAPATVCAAADRACVLDRASATARTIGDGFGRSVALRAVAEALEKAGLSAVATATKAEAVTSFRQTAGQDSVSLATTAITLLDLGAKHDAAVMLARAERALPIGAAFQRGYALRQIAEVQVRLGAREAAAATLKTALEAARSATDPDRRASELTVIGAALHAASMDGAAEPLAEAATAAAGIAGGRERAKELGFVAEAQFKAGLVDAAATTLKNAIESAAALDSSQRLSVLQSIAVTRVSVGSLEAADELDRALDEVGGTATGSDLRLAAQLELAGRLAKRGKRSQAEAVLGAAATTARETGRAFAMLSLAETRLNAGFPDEALIAFREAPSEPGASEARLRNPYALPGSDPVAEGTDAYNAQRVDFLCSFARHRSAGARPSDLSGVVSEALDLAHAISDPKRRAAALEYIARLMMDLRVTGAAPLLAEASATLVDVGSAAQRRDDPTSRMNALADTTRRLVRLAELQNKAGAGSGAAHTIDEALAIADAMIPKRPLHDEVVEGLVAALTWQERVPEALERAEAITDPGRRVRALIAIADGMRP